MVFKVLKSVRCKIDHDLWLDTMVNTKEYQRHYIRKSYEIIVVTPGGNYVTCSPVKRFHLYLFQLPRWLRTFINDYSIICHNYGNILDFKTGRINDKMNGVMLGGHN